MRHYIRNPSSGTLLTGLPYTPRSITRLRQYLFANYALLTKKRLCSEYKSRQSILTTRFERGMTQPWPWKSCGGPLGHLVPKSAHLWASLMMVPLRHDFIQYCTSKRQLWSAARRNGRLLYASYSLNRLSHLFFCREPTPISRAQA